MVQTVQSPLTIADYCAAIDRREIAPNNEYQRSDKVWPPSARSFLVETILLGYPLPKIFLFQKTDLKSKRTVKEIVDGQQRSKTIYDFFSNKLVLSQKSEIEQARGKTYDQLDDELKGRFLNYLLSIDLFVSASAAQIRQAFRRLNSYTVPLNPEELRHADFQGEFKWFIYKVTRDYEETMLQLGIMGEKQIVRMQDTKLFAECVHALLNGVKTTSATSLNNLYRQFDKTFPESERIRKRIDDAMAFIVDMPDVHQGPLMKPHVFYSLFLATTHTLDPLEALATIFVPPEPYVFKADIVAANLSALAEALETDNPDRKFQRFVDAAAARTNVEAQRVVRIEWLGKALQPALL
jgi:Protein of unknown function DUF262